MTVLRLGEDNVSQTFKRLTDAKPLNTAVYIYRDYIQFLFFT